MGEHQVHVATPDRSRLEHIAADRGWRIDADSEGFVLHGTTAAEVGAVAFAEQLELHALIDGAADLENVFLRLTGRISTTRRYPPRMDSP